MQVKLKQRIVGIAVLATVALIIIVFLLHPSAKEQQVTLNVPVSMRLSESEMNTPSLTTQQPSFSSSAATAITQASIATKSASSTPEFTSTQSSSTGPTVGMSLAKPAAVSRVKKSPKFINATTLSGNVKRLKHSNQSTKVPARSRDFSLKTKAWSVQLASFKNKQNAKNLIQSLRKRGFAAYAKPFKTQKGWMTRIFVGPEIRRNDAEKLLVKLQKLFHIKGLVIEYRV